MIQRIFFSYTAWVLFLLFQSCSEENQELVTIKTNEVSSFTVSSATVTGIIISDGNSEILERGVCWSTNPNPALENASPPKIINYDSNPVTPVEPLPTIFYRKAQNTGNQFSVDLFRLCSNTTYYVRAYAINSQGIAYGNGVSFTTMDIRQVVSIRTDKLSYRLCEPIVITITNNSPKDTLVYSVCQEKIMGIEQMLKPDGGWYTTGNLCFTTEISIEQLLPLQNLIDVWEWSSDSECGKTAGSYLMSYRLNTTAGPVCLPNFRQNADVSTNLYQLVE